VLAAQGVRARGDGRDRWWTTSVGDAETVHDVFGLDARPHDDAHLGEGGADLGEFDGEGLLGGVEPAGPIEQGRAFGVEGGELLWAVRHASIADRKTDGRHVNSPEQKTRKGKLDAR